MDEPKAINFGEITDIAAPPAAVGAGGDITGGVIGGVSGMKLILINRFVHSLFVCLFVAPLLLLLCVVLPWDCWVV